MCLDETQPLNSRRFIEIVKREKEHRHMHEKEKKKKQREEDSKFIGFSSDLMSERFLEMGWWLY